MKSYRVTVELSDAQVREFPESALVCTAKDRTCGRFGLYKDDDQRLRNALGFRA